MSYIKYKFTKIYKVNQMNEEKMKAIIQKFGEEQVNYTLDRLFGDIPREDQVRGQPYVHFENVCNRMAQAYARAQTGTRSGTYRRMEDKQSISRSKRKFYGRRK